MISPDESWVSESEHSQMLTLVENQCFELWAHKVNLRYEDISIEGVPTEETQDWDAVYLSPRLIRVIDGVLYWSNLDGTDAGSLAIPSYTNSAPRPLILTSSFPNAVSVYYVKSNAIWKARFLLSGVDYVLDTNAATTINFSLTGSEQITNIAGAAMGSFHIVHAVITDTTKRIHNLRCSVGFSNGTGTQTMTASDFWYQYPIQSIDVATFDNDKQAIVMATQTPGIISTKSQNDTVYQYIEVSAGIIEVIFNNTTKTYSDHFDIDVVDNCSTARMRRDVRISRMASGDEIFAITAYCVAGTNEHPFSSYRFYTSVDCKHWSMGRIMPIDMTPNRKGLKLLRVSPDQYTYAVDGGHFLRSDNSSRFILPYNMPEELKVNITADVRGLRMTQDKAAQLNIELENEGHIYDGHPILNPANTIGLELFVGYVIDGFRAMELGGWYEVDTMSFDRADTNNAISMVARDAMARLTDKTTSEEALYWEGQMVGGDRFTDYTQTRYGGLKHTAVQSGSWMTIDNTLQLRSSNEVGTAFSTFDPYIWNGAYETKFTLAMLGNSELAGIVFRALNKDNYLYAVYEQATDRVYLKEKRTGVATATLTTSASTMGWSGSLVGRYMRVEFRYARVRVLTSNDGITWTLTLNTLLSGQHATLTIGSALFDRGYCGLMAKGYAPEENWTFPIFTIPNFTWEPFDFNFDPLVPYDFITTESPYAGSASAVGAIGEGGFPTGSAKSLAMAFGDNHVAWTASYKSASPVWKVWTHNHGRIPLAGRIDKKSPYVLGTGSALNAYVLSSHGSIDDVYLYRVTNLQDSAFGDPTVGWAINNWVNYATLDIHWKANGEMLMVVVIEDSKGTLIKVYEGIDPGDVDEWRTLDLRARQQTGVPDPDDDQDFGGSGDDRILQTIFNTTTRKITTTSAIWAGYPGWWLYEIVEVDFDTLAWESIEMEETNSWLPDGGAYARHDFGGSLVSHNRYQHWPRPQIARTPGGNLYISEERQTDGYEFALPVHDYEISSAAQITDVTGGTLYRIDHADLNTNSVTQIKSALGRYAGDVGWSTILDRYAIRTKNLNYWYDGYDEINWDNPIGDPDNTYLTMPDIGFKVTLNDVGAGQIEGIRQLARRFAYNFSRNVNRFGISGYMDGRLIGEVYFSIEVTDANGVWTYNITYTDSLGGLGANDNSVYYGRYFGSSGAPSGIPGGYGTFDVYGIFTASSGTGVSDLNYPMVFEDISQIVFEVQLSDIILAESIGHFDIGFYGQNDDAYRMRNFWLIQRHVETDEWLWAYKPIDIDGKNKKIHMNFGGSKGTGYCAIGWAANDDSQAIEQLMYSQDGNHWVSQPINPTFQDDYEPRNYQVVTKPGVPTVFGEYIHEYGDDGFIDKTGDIRTKGVFYISDMDWV
jgi:hypothetical protein